MLTQKQPLKVYRLKVNILETPVTAYTANELGDNGNQGYYLRAADLPVLINRLDEIKSIAESHYAFTFGC